MKPPISYLLFVLSALFFNFSVSAQLNNPGKLIKKTSIPGLEQCDIVVTTPGKDFHDAMPTGNGDIGISMWIEKNGDLLFYISKTDSYDDNNRLLKPGLIRVSISPSPFKSDSSFTQRLRLRESAITVATGSGDNLFNLRLWVDANHPVISLEMNGNKKFTSTVQLQNWRRQPRLMEDDLSFSDPFNTGFDGVKSNQTTIQYPDTILHQQNNEITWYHHNTHSCWPFTLTLQGLEALTKTQTDPLLNNVFGATIDGSGLLQQNDTTLASEKPVTKQNISIHVLGETNTTPSAWLSDLNAQKASIEKLNIDQCRARHEQWWNNFWSRSFIKIQTGNDTGALLTRGYNLQRYMVACSGRGKGWIKFNGSIFSLPNEKDADFRRWGSAEWFQNARLVYWPAINAGDFDMVSPFYATYLNALPLVKKRTDLYYGHKGAFFSETSYAWGTYVNGDYGFNREGNAPGFVTNPYVRRHWSCGLELSAMMLHQYAITNDPKFMTDTLLPIATEVIRFYNEHWKRGTDGKILFDPAQSLETWQIAVNPMPEIAGMKYVLTALINLPKQFASAQQRTDWKKMLNDLPALPMKTVGDSVFLLPAQKITEASNTENPELYAVFPFPLFGLNRPSIQIAKNTFARRANKESRCWYQDDAQAAFLGLASEAANGITRRMMDWNKDYAFPAMWGPGDDGLPDMDHGGVGQLALQAMLMQTVNNKILLFPAWPKSWDVSFRFPATDKTIVAGELKNGKLIKLKVTPAVRGKDVVVLPLQ